VIDLDTLRNHLKKIPQAESDKAFYKHIKLLRDKRWITVKKEERKRKRRSGSVASTDFP